MDKKLEPRYVVLKMKDLFDARNKGLISDSDLGVLDRIGRFVGQARHLRGKSELVCAVVESDWPIYPEVVDKLIGQNPKPRFFWVAERTEIYCGLSIDAIKEIVGREEKIEIEKGNYGEITDNCPIRDPETGDWVFLYDLAGENWQIKPHQVCSSYP